MAGKILSNCLSGLNRAQIDLLIECRDEEEAIEQLRIRGYELDVDELDAIKLAYEKRNEISDANSLSLEQLSKVAGGARQAFELRVSKKRRNEMVQTGLALTKSGGELGVAIDAVLHSGEQNGEQNGGLHEIQFEKLDEEQREGYANAYVTAACRMASEKQGQLDEEILEAVQNEFLKVAHGGKADKYSIWEQEHIVVFTARVGEVLKGTGNYEKNGKIDFKRIAHDALEISALHNNRGEGEKLHFVDEKNADDHGQRLVVNTIQKRLEFHKQQYLFNADVVEDSDGNRKNTLEPRVNEAGKPMRVNLVDNPDDLFDAFSARYEKSESYEGIKLTNGESDKILFSNLVENGAQLVDGKPGNAWTARFDAFENVINVAKAVRNKENINEELQANIDRDLQGTMVLTDVLYVMEKHADQRKWNILMKKEGFAQNEKEELANFIAMHAQDIKDRHKYVSENDAKISNHMRAQNAIERRVRTAKQTAAGFGIATTAGLGTAVVPGLTYGFVSGATSFAAAFPAIAKVFTVGLPALFKGGTAAFAACFAGKTSLGLAATCLAGTGIAGVAVIGLITAGIIWGVMKHRNKESLEFNGPLAQLGGGANLLKNLNDDSGKGKGDSGSSGESSGSGNQNPAVIANANKNRNEQQRVEPGAEVKPANDGKINQDNEGLRQQPAPTGANGSFSNGGVNIVQDKPEPATGGTNDENLDPNKGKEATA